MIALFLGFWIALASALLGASAAGLTLQMSTAHVRLATMFVLDALFDRFQQISSNVEIIGSLVQRSPEKASEVERLARLCRADGLRAGISERDLEEPAGGDLVAFYGRGVGCGRGTAN